MATMSSNKGENNSIQLLKEEYLIQNNKELKEAETDKFTGFYFTKEDLEKEVENW